MTSESRSAGHPWRTYVIASIPGWLVGVIVTVVLHRTMDLPALAAVLVILAWIATDLAMFPRVRRFYSSEPAARRMVGETGVTVSSVTPRGFARVHGELWQVRAADAQAALPEGAGVRVREIHGLELLVEPTGDTHRAART